MKRSYRMIGLLLAVLLVIGSAPLTIFAKTVQDVFGIGDQANSQPAIKDDSFKVDYSDVTSLYDVTELFKKHYNPDLVSANKLQADKDYTLIVQLDGFNLTQYWELEGKEGALDAYIASPAGKTHAAAIQKDVDRYLAELDAKGIAYEKLWTYDTVLKAVAIRVSGANANAAAGVSGVAVASVSTRYDSPKVTEIENNVNVYSTGIYNTSGIDRTLRGEGTLVAVLDTGLDYTHGAFQTDNFKADSNKLALTYDQLVDILANREFTAENLSQGLTVDDVYISIKVPYAYDYADKDSDVFPSYSYHGVHVAGIIAGNYTKVPAGSRWLEDEDLIFEPVLDENGNPTGDYYFEGVAPDAQLAIMKVFSDDLEDEQLGGADSADILMALDDCPKLGVDVINMSLGSSAGFSSYSDNIENIVMSQVYTAIYAAGISLVCAASNDYSSGYGGVNGTNLTSNPDSATVGSPSTYPAAISVASIDGRRSPYFLANKGGAVETMVFFTESNDGNSNKRDFMKQMYALAGKDLATDTLEVGYVVIGGVGRGFNYSMVRSKIDNLKQQGKLVVALVARGDTSFEDKMVSAMEAGCDAIVVRNNVAGGISMTMGKTNEEEMIPAVSISLDIGQELVDNAVNGVGTLTLNAGFSAGPFMSDFSSWGPTPSLELKPEITSYGGNVTSAVTGGYDVYSGTSMASPNMAGACAIIRTYVKRNFPEYNANEVAALTYQLLMSTARIALNEYGDPYSPRKQGAGIADIESVLSSVTYAWTKNNDGSVSDKTKLQLGDDPARNGVYTMTYYVTNMSNNAVTYTLGEYVMTERVSSDGLTVAERAYLFSDYNAAYTADGAAVGADRKITLQAGATVEVTVKITLSAEDKAYLNDNFENGMYVEGFLTLSAESEDVMDLSIPYLAFYGDWTDAPMLDYSAYEMSEIEQDDSIPDDEKPRISFFATSPYAKYGEEYILPMGHYIYGMSDDMTKIYADSEHAAVSMYQGARREHYTTYNFYAVYAGLLRGAKVCNFRITDAYTGAVIYEKELRNVSKGYARGGSARPGFVEVEFNPYELGLPNNGKYHFSMEAYLDYGDGTKGNSNTFEFEFYTDYESPTLTDVELRYVTRKENEKDVTHIYLDVSTFDNHYTQCLLLCYVDEKNELQLATEYVTPVYGSTRGSVVKTTIEITDLYEQYFDNLYVQVQDYAMNYTVFNLNLASHINFPASITFAEEQVTLMQNEAMKPAYTFTPDDAQNYDLIWKSSDESVARVQDGEIFGVGEGTAEITVYATADDTTMASPTATIRVTVTGDKKTDRIQLQSITFDLILDRYNRPVNPTNAEVEVRPNAEYKLNILQKPWYGDVGEVRWSTSNPLVATVDENGVVHTLKDGTATIAAESGVCSVFIRMVVSEEYIINSYRLVRYFGPGGDVVVPEKYNFMYIDEEVFMDNQEITSIVIPDGVTEIYKDAFKNCRNLKKVVIPDTVTYIHESAFENCTALEELDISQTLSIIVGKRCFYGCSSLQRIISDDRGCRIVAAWDEAFAGCVSLTEYDALNLCIVGKNVFEGCTSLEKVNITQYTVIGEGMFKDCISLKALTLPVHTVGDNAFAGCTGLTDLSFTADWLRIGTTAFANCTKLNNIRFTCDSVEIGRGAFADCKGLTVLDLPDCAVSLGESAFSGCSSLVRVYLNQNTKITMAGPAVFENCTSFRNLAMRAPAENGKTANYQIIDNTLYSADGSTLVLLPTGRSAAALTLPAGVTVIGDGALCCHSELTAFDLNGITEIGAYAFAQTGLEGTLLIPASVKTIKEGAFYGCSALRQVQFDAASQLSALPAYCFTGCSNLNTVFLPDSLVSIGGYAFMSCGLNALTLVGTESNEGLLDGTAFTKLQNIGDAAFYATRFETVQLPNTLKSIGEMAFANCARLTEADFMDGVQGLSLGDGLFFGSVALERVKLPEGLERIGSNTFSANTTRTALQEVILPHSLREIGAYAFAANAGLVTLNLGDTQVSELAPYVFFGCENLKNIDFSKIVTVGEAALAYNRAMEVIELPLATYIGDQAFYGVGAVEVRFPVAEYLGAEALMYSDIQTVTLPATLEFVGYGALSYIETLTEIRMPEASAKYFVDRLVDENGTTLEYGVLYSILPNGTYQLEGFPGGLEWSSYSVLDGTIRIADEAFLGVQGLEAIVMPATLKLIGSRAFFLAEVKTYSFTSVNAPVLECEYVDASKYDTNTWIYQVFYRGTGGMGMEQFYANFYYFSILAELADEDYELVLNSPENGYGYDSPIWKNFFSTNEYIAEVPDNFTLNAAEAIGNLKTPAEIAAMSESEFRAYLATAARARTLFNSVLPGRQTEYIHGDYDGVNYEQMLLDVETVVRAKRDQIGMGNPVSYLRIITKPNKLIYVERDRFETEGMTVKAIYEDGSEVVLAEYELERSIAVRGCKYLTVLALGNKVSVEVTVSNSEAFTVVAEPATENLICKLDVLLGTEELTALKGDALVQYAAAVAEMRQQYNAITSAEQLGLLSGDYNGINYTDKLTTCEAVLRSLKAEAGIANPIVSLQIVTAPAKTVYEAGEELDLSGMRVVAVYADGSMEDVTSYTVNSTVAQGDTIEVAYAGLTATTPITVEVPAAEQNGNGWVVWLCVGIALACAVSGAGGYFFVGKKTAAKNSDGKKDEEEK